MDLPSGLHPFWRRSRTFGIALLIGAVYALDMASGDEESALVPLPVANHNQADNPVSPNDSATGAEILRQYCLDCHGGDEPSGGIALSADQDAATMFRQGKDWDRVAAVVRDRRMPPAEAEQLSDQQRQQLRDWISTTLRDEAKRSPPNPGRPTIRRLNRTQYANTIADLLGVTGDWAMELPVDPAGHGFDNNGDVLFIPPVLMEKYLLITRSILEAVSADSAAKMRLLGTVPEEKRQWGSAARAQLEPFLKKAFRRPVAKREIDARVKMVERLGKEGMSYDEAMHAAVSSVLMSPYFLFRYEADRPGRNPNQAFRLTDHELASRLSYFLWSTMPDQTLFDLADKKQLRKPAVLSEQVSRMLADPRAKNLADDFAAQWFRFREILTLGVDFRSYPRFNDRLRRDMYGEASRFVQQLVASNGSLLDLLDADYAILNQRLAEHYGIAGVEGEDLRKVELADRRRGGLLGMGAILTVTSYPTRTSPVLRGKWILEEILGTPPPPPPPNVPALDVVKKEEPLSLRARLEAHRQQASCASCHNLMDPLGFGMENFDGIGQWREEQDQVPIDSSGELPDGSRFAGPAELKEVLLRRKEQFAQVAIERIFTYAIGRPPEYFDELTLQTLQTELVRDDFRVHTLVQGIVASYPFQYRQSATGETRSPATNPKDGESPP